MKPFVDWCVEWSLELLEVFWLLCAAFGWGWLTVLLLRTVLLLVGRASRRGELRFEEKPQKTVIQVTVTKSRERWSDGEWITYGHKIKRFYEGKEENSVPANRKEQGFKFRNSIHGRLFTDWMKMNEMACRPLVNWTTRSHIHTFVYVSQGRSLRFVPSHQTGTQVTQKSVNERSVIRCGWIIIIVHAPFFRKRCEVHNKSSEGWERIDLIFKKELHLAQNIW